MNEVQVAALKPRHNKCNELLVINDLYLTEAHELLVLGYCSKCLINVSLCVPLTELWDNCPAPETTPESVITDEIFLHSLGVRLLPEVKCLPPSP